MEPSLQTFFNLSPDLLCIRNQNGYFQDVNAAWTDVLGWTIEELTTRPWIEFVHVDDVAETIAIDSPFCLLESSNPVDRASTVQYKNRYRHKSGGYRWLSWRLSPYHDGISYGIAQDVTDKSWSGNRGFRTEIQEAIRLRDRAIAASNVGIVIADTRLPDQPLIYVNPAFEQITGYAAVEVLGLNCRFLQGKEKNQPEINELREAVRAGKDCTVVLRNYRKNGELFWNELHISPIYDANGMLSHFIGVQTDISDRKRAEVALQAETEKSERLLLNVLPKPIADRLKEFQIGLTKRNYEAFIADRFEEATILFADLVGFTEIASDSSPTALIGLLNRIFSVFDQLSEQYGLEKIKTIGDAYMVVGGLPEYRPDHIEAIAEMALAMQAAISQFQSDQGKPLQIRIGINTGSVVAGVIGIKKFIYDLWGDAVNVASRMESSGEPGKIQVTEAVYHRLQGKYRFDARGTIPIKGKGNMTTYWLVGKHC